MKPTFCCYFFISFLFSFIRSDDQKLEDIEGNGCKTWFDVEGYWQSQLQTNADEIVHTTSATMEISTQITEVQQRQDILNSLQNAIKEKGFAFISNMTNTETSKSQQQLYPYDTKTVTQLVSETESIQLTKTNNEKQLMTVYQWVIKAKLGENSDLTSIQLKSKGTLFLPSKYMPKCPLGFCADNLCQSCAVPSFGVQQCSYEQKCQESNDFMCLTERFKCKRSDLKVDQKVNYSCKEQDQCKDSYKLEVYKVIQPPSFSVCCTKDPYKQKPVKCTYKRTCDSYYNNCLSNRVVCESTLNESRECKELAKCDDIYKIEALKQFSICCDNNPFLAFYCDKSIDSSANKYTFTTILYLIFVFMII